MMQRHLFQGMQSWQRATADIYAKLNTKRRFSKCIIKSVTIKEEPLI